MTALRAFFVALLICWVGTAAADVAVPPLTGRVVDQTGTLTASDITSLTQRLKELESRKGSQVAVLIVPTTEPETIEEFSIRVAEAWKIGRRKIDDGALLVIAKNDHHMRIEVGYGLEGSLTDVTSHRIIDEVITPRFRAGDFAGGISDGIGRIIAVIDGEPLPPPAPAPRMSSDSDFESVFIFAIFGIYVVSAICRSLFGRLIGSAAAGVVVSGLGWYLLGSVMLAILLGGLVSALTFFAEGLFAAGQSAGRRSGSGWSGGGFSGGSGWSSGSSSRDSDSGFSGGGGSFGGGGASGSW